MNWPGGGFRHGSEIDLLGNADSVFAGVGNTEFGETATLLY